jgi:dienelactone hydrolase
MDLSALPLMDKIMEPASWFTTIVYKPVWIVQALMIAIPWKRASDISVTKDRVLSFFQAVRTSPPPFETNNLKVGAAGFCWGGKHAFLLARDEASSRATRHQSQIDAKTPQALLDCIFTAHPSYLEVPNDMQAIKVPTSVAIGDKDMAMKESLVKQMKQILEVDMEGGDHEVNIIPGAKHGFAIRTHPDDKHEMECAERAEAQAVAWFSRWFSS